MRGLKFITLDVTNTILKIKGGVGARYQAVGAQYGLFTDQAAALIENNFHQFFKHYWKMHGNFGYGAIEAADWWNLVTRDTAAALCREGGLTVQPDNLSEFCDSLHRHFSTGEAYEVLPGVKATLLSMKSAGISMGVITNNDSRIHNVLCELIGPEYFTFILTSNEEGSAKPDTGMFRKAGELANVDWAHMLHVGDSYLKDYLPATSLGMNAVLVTTEPCPHNCIRIDRFHELTKFLDLR